MRIATKTVYDNINTNLANVSDAMIEANNVVSSGKRINNLSDDPVGLVNVLDLRSSLSNIDQLGKNITLGKSWLTMGESALGQVEEILTQAEALCVEMSSGTRSGTERQNASTVVDGYLRQILSLANTQVGGRYVFAGTATDTQPFAFDNDTNPTQVTYSGNDTAFSAKIGKTLTVEVGRDGEQIFGDDAFDWSDPSEGHDNIFKTLLDLKTALQDNDVPGIQAAMGKLDNHGGNVRNLVSDTGAKTIRMNVKEEIIQELELTYTDRKSQIEDADITEAIMNLKTKELAYQAALSSSAKVMSLSLVNFL